MLRILMAFHLLFFAFTQALFSSSVTPPGQPEKGPGGKEYFHSEVVKNRYETGIKEYWLYEPGSPRPSSAPVIVFLHGWSATNPMVYGAWIEHLVKRGNIVIYPRYQEDLRTPLNDLSSNALEAIRAAILRLKTEDNHVKPDLSKFAIVGHSVGGIISANIAALAKEKGLPDPLAVMSVEPGRTWNPGQRFSVPLEDLSKIPQNTLLLSIAGDSDHLARDTDAKRIYSESDQIPSENKDFITLISDQHGSPQLIANHFAPNAPDKSYDNGEKRGSQEEDDRLRKRFRERIRKDLVFSSEQEADENLAELQDGNLELMTNAIDYFGLWKLFDGLCDAAFYAKNRNYALGDTHEQRFMGFWSDGKPVKELEVTDTP